MNTALFRSSGEGQLDRSPAEMAWLVLEAANDLGDNATVEVCRRVIDADLSGKAASPGDLQVLVHYFR
ncbi:MAG TPA: hypothetical protein VKR55_16915 [Bradyrhizobium sp.]|uniref:hypothetical protein n=1 Tax=Bradyrhizobium sp. TaxID=376 RepID=UPI002C82FD81|nr:hypothetical protein [Bradyrhizobium sp.]HLZ03816.1 hypothetical protein [Bradyrhizobium sp.]